MNTYTPANPSLLTFTAVRADMPILVRRYEAEGWKLDTATPDGARWKVIMWKPEVPKQGEMFPETKPRI